MVLARFAGFFSEINTAFQEQVCEHKPHLIQTSSAIEMVPPISSRVIALTGHGSTQVPQPTQIINVNRSFTFKVNNFAFRFYNTRNTNYINQDRCLHIFDTLPTEKPSTSLNRFQ